MDRIIENVNSYVENLNDGDSDSELNPEQLLNEWLGELDNLTVGLETISSTSGRTNLKQPLTSEISAPRIDSYRFSMANLEDSQDVDLDAILGELCALETQCDEDIDHAKIHKRSSQSSDYNRQQQHQSRSHSRSSSDGNRCLKLDPGESELMLKNDGSIRTDSPDNDSAFSDTVSMLSSESSASSSTGVGTTNSTNANTGIKSSHFTSNLNNTQDSATRIKAEKIRMALEKMKEASVKKLFIKAFTTDGSTKSLLVDEKMTCGYVTRLLADKNHVQMDPKWAIVEHLPELYMERVYEDHELLVENLMLWTRDSKNKIIFMERYDKVQMFLQPEQYLTTSSTDDPNTDLYYDDHSRMLLLEEYFNSPTNLIQLPDLQTNLYLKSDTKKGWKKYHFILRASGIYYCPKEMNSKSLGVKSLGRDLICLATFDNNQIYYGVGWKKKFKAPTDYCFAIKHPRLQHSKSTKYIKYLCAEDQLTLDRWMCAMKIAKYGRRLMDNYRILVDDLAQDDLDMLAHARSCSVTSIAKQNQSQPPPSSEPPSGRHSRASSSSSSGCMSDGGDNQWRSSTETTNAFDSEFPMGTIKRKPSMKPSLPLTSITRQLKEVGEILRDNDADDDGDDLSPGSGDIITTNSGTLTRRHTTNRRKSSSSGGTADENSTLKRYQHSYNRIRTSCSSMDSIKSDHNLTPTSSSSPIYPGAHVTTSSSMDEPIASLPPPPTTHEEQNHHQRHYQHYHHPQSNEDLPPPPPPPPILSNQDDLFKSTLSLDSLPPPPGPGELPALHSNIGNDHISGSQLSLISLPPPPPPPTATPYCDTLKLHQNKIRSSSTSSSGGDLTPNGTASPQQIFFNQATGTIRPNTMGSVPPTSGTGTHIKSPKKVIKKITFNLPPTTNGDHEDSMGDVSVLPPPPVPKRSEKTKLTSPKKLSNSASAPPTEFLKDLQRVMRKKWQVAQKCKLEPTTTPHEVLGFRDPPPGDDYRETNVSNWVEQHYGGVGDVLVDNLYENVYPTSNNVYSTQPVSIQRRPSSISSSTTSSSTVGGVRCKRKPPPPPLRSETTQLSTSSNSNAHVQQQTLCNNGTKLY